MVTRGLCRPVQWHGLKEKVTCGSEEAGASLHTLDCTISKQKAVLGELLIHLIIKLRAEFVKMALSMFSVVILVYICYLNPLSFFLHTKFASVS